MAKTTQLVADASGCSIVTASPSLGRSIRSFIFDSIHLTGQKLRNPSKADFVQYKQSTYKLTQVPLKIALVVLVALRYFSVRESVLQAGRSVNSVTTTPIALRLSYERRGARSILH